MFFKVRPVFEIVYRILLTIDFRDYWAFGMHSDCPRLLFHPNMHCDDLEICFRDKECLIRIFEDDEDPTLIERVLYQDPNMLKTMFCVLEACGVNVDVPKHVIDNGQKELARLNMWLSMPRKKTAADLALDAMEEKIARAIKGKVYVTYSAYEDADDDDDTPIDNLDEVAVPGKVILIGERDEYRSTDYRSEVLENPTWLQVAVCANDMIKKTRDYHECHFLEYLEEKGTEGDVTIYKFEMGS